MQRIQIRKEQWVILIAFILLFSVLLGVFPGCQLPNLVLSTWWGSAKDLLNNSNWFDFTCDNVGYGYETGIQFNEGYSIGLIIRLFLSVGLDEVFSLSLCFFVLYLLGAVALFYALLMISNHFWMTLFGMGMYYLIPALRINGTIAPTYFGWLLIPVCILCDCLLISCISNRNKKNVISVVVIGIASFLGKLLLVSTTWYLSVIYAVLSCLVLQGVLILDNHRQLKRFVKDEMFFILLGVLMWMLAMFIIQCLMPAGTADIAYGLERYNGSSVDVLTMIIPSDTQKLSDYININLFIPDGRKLTGDVGMHANYLGLVMVACNVWGATNKKYRDKYSIVFFVVGLIMLVLSLGPALKFGTMIADNKFAYEVDMEGQLVFPWKNLYFLFPLNKMRTTYRWIFGTYICLVVGFVYMISKVIKDKKNYILCSVLIFLAFVEYFPNNTVNTVKGTFHNYDMAQQQKADICDELRPFVKEGAVAVISNFGSSKNCYLSICIGSDLNLKLWNVTGDKNVGFTADSQTEEIKGILKESSSEELIHYTDMVLTSGDADYVIFPTFDLRYDVYSWPEEQATRDNRLESMNLLESDLADEYSCIRTQHYLIVSKTH